MKHNSDSKIIVVWLPAALLVAGILSYLDFSSTRSELLTKAASLHRLVSQRADQHDAHLTGLSALASAYDEPLTDMILNLSKTIQKFYPRIEHVDLVKLDSSNPIVSFSTRPLP
ncbi:MAG: two-component sensor histidine kinase, partial [Alphaproteobacteria bacterium]|nr:two-component sensor histidine kinase [Alphaproteobacteria bacterium]